MNFHHYCIVRDDLPPGVVAAQLVHAAGESNPGGLHCYAVVLAVTKEKLHLIEEKLIEISAEHCSIHESDEPYNGEMMAIGINPFCRTDTSKKTKELRKILSGIKLYR